MKKKKKPKYNMANYIGFALATILLIISIFSGLPALEEKLTPVASYLNLGLLIILLISQE